MEECIFCKIIKRDVPSTVVYEDDAVFAFHDINPQARVHVLIVPKRHIESIDALDVSNAHVAADLLLAAKKIAKKMGIDQTGYRLISNCGQGAGQTVFHLHFHLLGGDLPSQLLAKNV